ncbi:hypothetical protein [Vitiosangium sp. GDMCC 1.1324]|uniref:hypothetical protein n=1 Tax=Vitiosangium sp. (strain GDMCC 1.1324) TaxID=2138576 RepID=UPI000D354182|nr:hypothetical protein [Vitiosangium sp. GDMCC 1.1324]PTL80854.1 hypothetical protein DAT35_26325 [Vitiosangium sp. GDMCC 1.1324]
MSLLVAPLHVDALFLRQRQAVVSATTHFTLLPYFDGEHGVHPEIPLLGERVAAEPFRPEHLLLESGIHLHWSMPAALTRASRWSRPEGVGMDALALPPVPNRWLVTRGHASTNLPERQWIIESDYLHPVGARPSTPTTCYPMRDSLGQPTGGVPYRHMGRVLPLNDWLAGPSPGPEHYLSEPLTVRGFGEHTFAAFYPNCQGVFGFHDGEVSVPQLSNLFYEVYGWYANPEHDYLAVALRRASRAADRASLSPQELWQSVMDDFRWTVVGALPRDLVPPRLTCRGRLDFDAHTRWDPPPPKGNATLTLGATAAEALASHLARSVSTDSQQQAHLEEQLQAVVLSSALDDRHLDLAMKFKEARHAAGFVALPSEPMWTLRAASGQGEEAAPAWPDVASLLDGLNALQAEYNRARERVRSLRRQLATDWHHYQLALHPDAPHDDRPNAMALRYFMERHSIPALRQLIDATGELRMPEPDSGQLPTAVGEAHSVAQRLVSRISALVAALARHDAEGGGAYVLQVAAAPRFYRPTDPVILIAGEAARASNRYVSTAASVEVYPLLGDTSGMSEAILPMALFRKLRPWRREGPGARPWTGEPWHPLLLEWEVELTPKDLGCNLSSPGEQYDPAFVMTNYVLRREAVDFAPRGTRPCTRGAHVYKGSTVLTPHALGQMESQLDSYLSRVESDPTQAPLSPDTRTRLREVVAQLRSGTLPCVTQALGGLNSALLMTGHTPQVPIADPLGFENDRDFARLVAEAVAGETHTVPLVANDFCPIRNGELHVRRLRILDTFGRAVNIDCHTLHGTRSFGGHSFEGAASLQLPPRLVQPARLDFRWRSADQGTREANAHPATTPVCGWVMANHLDRSLFCFDREGVALGVIWVEADAVPRWRPAPGRQVSAESGGGVSDVGDPTLRQFVRFLLRGSANYFHTFLADLEDAQNHIEPEHPGEVLLSGQPLALVRASLHLELQGLPAMHQGLKELRESLLRSERETNGFTRVRFPIRLGEPDQLGDGLAVYWVEDGKGGYEDDAYVIPYYDPGDGSGTPQQKKCDFLYQSVDAPPLAVTMLVDPRGAVHATSGIMPTKALRLPAQHWASVYERIAVEFTAAPVLTGRTENPVEGAIELPMGAVPGRAWTWLEATPEGWGRRPVEAAQARVPFDAVTEIRDGWLVSEPSNPRGGS